MKSTSLFRSAALLAALALAVPAFSKPMTKTIEISRSANLGKASLSAGEYRLTIDGNRVTVKKNDKVVAEAEGRWEERNDKASYDSVEIAGNGQIQLITFAGQKRIFVLNE